MEPLHTFKISQDPVIARLRSLLDTHSDKRVIVVGTTCTGKTTMLAYIAQGRDQDKEIFPLLSKIEAEYVCQVPWTPEIGQTMSRLVKERVRAEIGRPLFGTVVVDSDLIVLLKISDELLLDRARSRGVDFTDAKKMQAHLEGEVRASGIPWLEHTVG